MTLNLPSLLFTENEFCVFIILNISAYWEIAQFIRTWDFFFPPGKTESVHTIQQIRLHNTTTF